MFLFDAQHRDNLRIRAWKGNSIRHYGGNIAGAFLFSLASTKNVVVFRIDTTLNFVYEMNTSFYLCLVLPNIIDNFLFWCSRMVVTPQTNAIPKTAPLEISSSSLLSLVRYVLALTIPCPPRSFFLDHRTSFAVVLAPATL